MTLDDAASQRQHASDIADADVVKYPINYPSGCAIDYGWWCRVHGRDYAICAAIASEREACATIAESVGENTDFDWATQEACDRIAREIRARR